ncbi:hypothetical protein [Sphingomonas yantingensis]|uniref:Uncharacterized protein n=1 Tax=Sphingomonas yantingensis TaxID=1241761 RepID=A0A7W9AML3_9SPHN|nr:hypothetical protein [Sphingomonas yantingensis]MBB5697027.1 hypothetical protein [Sphingomonas yantingensis]
MIQFHQEGAALANNQRGGKSMTDANAWKWWAGRDEEWFDVGPCDTREQAIEEGHASHEDGFHIIEALPGDLKFSAARMIDDQYYEADDLFDFDHTEPDRSGPHQEADAELQALLDAWTEKWGHTFVTPTMFRATRNGEHVRARYLEAGPLSADEEADLTALDALSKAGDSMTLDEGSRRYTLNARRVHFARESAGA